MITKITDEVIDRLIEGDVLIYSDIYTIEDDFFTHEIRLLEIAAISYSELK